MIASDPRRRQAVEAIRGTLREPAVAASALGFLPELALMWHEGVNHAGTERASARSKAFCVGGGARG
jgi:hypothetical protein